MEKEAYFYRGSPQEKDNQGNFNRAFDRDICIMKNIAKDKGYTVNELNSENFYSSLDSYSGNDFLFYYVGHGDNGSFEKKNLEDVASKIEGKKGNKMIILDACAGGDKVENFKLPDRTKIITAGEVPLNSSIAMMLWDHFYAFGRDFDDLNKSSFENMKHNWIYFREQKNG